MGNKEDDKIHLKWLYGRLLLHNENPNCDYMQRLIKIINKMSNVEPDISFNFSDKNGDKINIGDRFNFSLRNREGSSAYCENLTGEFEFNPDDLRFEINIFNNDSYVCLWYKPEYMSEFELIK